MASHLQNRNGIFAMLASMACFSVNDTLLKLVSGDLGSGQIMAVRGIFAVACGLGLMAALRLLHTLPLMLNRVVLFRALIEAVLAYFFIAALRQLPLANVTAITQATPIIMALLTVVLGIETVGWRRWMAIVVGFAGVVLVVRPSWDGVDISVTYALLTAVLIAVRDLITRYVPSDVPTPAITVSTTFAVSVAGAAISFSGLDGTSWHSVAPQSAALLAVAAAIVTAGNIAIIAAFRRTDVSVISPFRYSVVVWAILLGYMIFGEWPDLLATIGIALIMGSGIYTVHRERIRSREAMLSPPEP